MQEFEELADYLPPPPQQQSYRNDNNGQYQQNNGSNSYPSNNGNSNANYNANNANNSGNYRQYNSNNGNGGSGNYQQGQRNWNGGNKGNFNKFQSKQPEGPTRLYKPYVITGNKEAPPHVIDVMRRLVSELETAGYTLRTGGLEGPDEAVESAVKDHTLFELVLPWKGFNNKESKFTFNTEQAFDTARMFHPSYDGLSEKIRPFLAKNARLVLGKDMRSHAMFTIVWSDDGAEHIKQRTAKTGNVGHVIAIASSMHIPVFNLQRPDAEQRLKQFLELI